MDPSRYFEVLPCRDDTLRHPQPGPARRNGAGTAEKKENLALVTYMLANGDGVPLLQSTMNGDDSPDPAPTA